MPDTPQFSVRCPLDLLVKIDALVVVAREEELARDGLTSRRRYGRTDVIVKLLREAMHAREHPLPLPQIAPPAASSRKKKPSTGRAAKVRTRKRR